MPYRSSPFINESFYHIFNRGVNKQPIFSEERDYHRFTETLFYYQFSGPKPRFSTHKRFKVKDFTNNPKIIEIISYCLMPNHFHLLIKQLKNGAIVEFLGKLSNSYTKYYNTKHRRSGHLFQGEFKSVSVDTDEQLLHLSRYIHLNPYVSGLIKDLGSYPYSSYLDYLADRDSPMLNKEIILNFFKEKGGYQKFISDHQDYAKELEKIKHALIDAD